MTSEQIDPVDIIESFLLEVIQQLPDDTDDLDKALSGFIPLIETIASKLKHQAEGIRKTVDRLYELLNYLKQIKVKTSDVSAKAALIDNILTRLGKFDE